MVDEETGEDKDYGANDCEGDQRPRYGFLFFGTTIRFLGRGSGPYIEEQRSNKTEESELEGEIENWNGRPAHGERIGG